ncbi:YhgE/Pip domain-containing protein [Solibacillus sp. CAU 1738]|uniref:YhgE/Pip domain-containing protein n=1 Tax=Solibacillus sp. CAU 1738 TaxID=3140363 RepID=UPI00326161EC
MKTILAIYKKDFRNILSNWVALIVILALIILPSLYAWFNIKASWDPYSNTSGILVALVNNDKGAVYQGRSFNTGNELIDKLKENESIGWRFVNKEEADNGVRYGKYYASITIPEDFSQNIVSITQNQPHKAELIYTVNEKKNAVAPKITKSGVTTIQQQVTSNIVETVNYLIFNIFNTLSVELTEKKPQIEHLIDIIYEVDQKIPAINKVVNDAYEGAVTLQTVVNHVQSNMPLIKDTVIKASDTAIKSREFLNRVKDALGNVNPYIIDSMTGLKTATEISNTFITNTITLIESAPTEARDLLVAARDHYAQAQKTISNLSDYINSLNTITNTNNLSATLDSWQTQENQLQNLFETTDMIINDIDNKKQISLDLLTKLKNDSQALGNALDNMVQSYDSTIAPSVDKTINEAISVVNNTNKLLQDANRDFPVLEDVLNTANSTLNIGIKDIEYLRKELPLIGNSIQSTAQKLKTLNQEQQFNEILRLLRLEAKKEAEFLASPVDIKQNSVYAIPNYGSAMSPFFTTLSLWVGALILVSLLSVNAISPSEKVNNSGIRKAYIGRYLTFVTIAVLQALIVTLGDLYLLKAYVVNKTLFILYGVFISIVFCMIVYTLVSVFGNIGKAIAMILLVLQISASGGTFPIEVMPEFFQTINPMLPFTYAIAGMREAVGGVLWSVLFENAAILLGYFVVFLVIGLAWKAPLRAQVAKFSEKFKESGLIDE